MWNIPNILTLLRILLIPVFVLIFYLPFGWARVGLRPGVRAGGGDRLAGWISRQALVPDLAIRDLPRSGSG